MMHRNMIIVLQTKHKEYSNQLSGMKSFVVAKALLTGKHRREERNIESTITHDKNKKHNKVFRKSESAERH